jgi:hypothetical protein
LALEQLSGDGQRGAGAILVAHRLAAFCFRRSPPECGAKIRALRGGEGVGGEIWSELRNQVFLGSEAFVEQMQQHILPDQPLREVPARQKRPVAKPLSFHITRQPIGNGTGRSLKPYIPHFSGAIS